MSRIPRVMVSSAAKEPLRGLVEDGIRPAEVLSIRPSADHDQLLVSAIARVDALVAILPRSGSFGRSAVMFDIGVALALNVAVLVVSVDGKAPRKIRDATVIPAKTDLGLRESVSQALQAVLANRDTAPYRDWPSSTLFFQGADTLPRHDAIKPPQGGNLEQLVMSAFQIAGASVAESKRGERDAADFAIWHESLGDVFGLPLPVETKSSRGRFPARPETYRAILEGAGTTSLLVVHDHGSSPRSWTDGVNLILLVDVDELVTSLDRSTPGRALELLLAKSGRP